MLDLQGKTAIVTGGGQGIGKAITLRLAAEGCNVAIFDLKPDTAEQTVAKAAPRAATSRSTASTCPTRKRSNEAVEQAEKDLGPTWLLVNNAGWDKPAPFLKTDKPLWDRIIAINLNGPLIMHKAVLPGMVARGGGRVVNIASDAARVGTSTEAVYSACKGGIIAFTKSVARELARDNVLLNCVCPGPTNTPMMQSVLGEGEQAEKWKDAMVRGIPLKRMGEPEDYAGIVAFLASADAGYITGQAISVSGGMNMV
jgi:2-hydroxycyclohexanecarboxyl-CoA dehydrogenase